MKTKKLFMLLIICLISFNTIIAKENNRNLEILDKLVELNEIPGLNFSIILKNNKQINYSSGFADTLNKIPLTPEHVMFSGSVGKTYAVAVLMQLVDDGKVDLNEKILNYFPEIDWLKSLPNIEEITVEMLLTHTSGLPRWINDPEVWKAALENPDMVWTYKDRLSYAFTMEPAHEPGKGWAYSDTNYLLIGMLIEKITGSDYYDEVISRILTPGELKNTYPSLTRDIPNLPVGHCSLGDPFNLPGKTVVDGKYIFNPLNSCVRNELSRGRSGIW